MYTNAYCQLNLLHPVVSNSQKALLHYWVNGFLFEMFINNSPIKHMFSEAYPYLQIPSNHFDFHILGIKLQRCLQQYLKCFLK